MVLQPIELLKISIIHYLLLSGTLIEHKRMSMKNFVVFEIYLKKAQVEFLPFIRDFPTKISSVSDPSVNCEILHEQTGTPIAQVSPLIIACFEGDVDIIRFFIEVSFNPCWTLWPFPFSVKLKRMVQIPIKRKVNII